MFSFISYWFWTILSYIGLISITTYVIPFLLSSFVFKEQDLKKKYNAKWAVVTGASSGIGYAIVEKLAEQKINVVLVALDDGVLATAMESLSLKYKSVQFKSCGVNLGAPGYMDKIKESVKDIDVSLLFNNAGFITMGIFASTNVNRLKANFECNAACQVEITHFFINQMIEKKLKGAIGFTSSPANRMPNPTSALYGSTKAFVTSFAASLAGEVRENNIDVCVVHPSPVSTSFYKDTKDTGTINMFKKTAIGPELIAGCFFKSFGRATICDQGYFSLMSKFLTLILDFNLFADILRYIAPYTDDYKQAKANEKKSK